MELINIIGFRSLEGLLINGINKTNPQKFKINISVDALFLDFLINKSHIPNPTILKTPIKTKYPFL
jgi:hypothetical protein